MHARVNVFYFLLKNFNAGTGKAFVEKIEFLNSIEAFTGSSKVLEIISGIIVISLLLTLLIILSDVRCGSIKAAGRDEVFEGGG